MKKSFIDELNYSRKKYETATVNFYNDGSVNTDSHSSFERATNISSWEYERAVDIMKDAVSSFSTYYDYDNVQLNVLMGLIYNVKDVDEDNNIKQGAKPINNIVRYYTLGTNCYLNDEQTNVNPYMGYGFQCYLNYNDFVRNLKKLGLNYNGPKTFEDFKNMILSKEKFDLIISANLLNETKDKKLVRKL